MHKLTNGEMPIPDASKLNPKEPGAGQGGEKPQEQGANPGQQPNTPGGDSTPATSPKGDQGQPAGEGSPAAQQPQTQTSVAVPDELMGLLGGQQQPPATQAPESTDPELQRLNDFLRNGGKLSDFMNDYSLSRERQAIAQDEDNFKVVSYRYQQEYGMTPEEADAYIRKVHGRVKGETVQDGESSKELPPDPAALASLKVEATKARDWLKQGSTPTATPTAAQQPQDKGVAVDQVYDGIVTHVTSSMDQPFEFSIPGMAGENISVEVPPDLKSDVQETLRNLSSQFGQPTRENIGQMVSSMKDAATRLVWASMGESIAESMVKSAIARTREQMLKEQSGMANPPAAGAPEKPRGVEPSQLQRLKQQFWNR